MKDEKMKNNQYLDKSEECLQARREFRKMLLEINNIELKDAYYKALVLSEHEAMRRVWVEIGG